MIHILRTLLILLVTVGAPLFGQGILPVEEGPIHEAFVSRDTENFELDTIPMPPPAPINERIPPQADRQAVWIPGYWSWDEKRNDFIWMSGVWRRPPPGHNWIAGSWRQFGEGWAWVPGFWSPQALNTLSYIDVPPPELLDENISQPNGGDFFWSPGYWEYSERGRGYAWVSGHWERLDSNWILVPAHYTWYNGSYVFVPAYWDWRLEDRGTVFSPVYIPPPLRTTIVYEPVIVVDNPIIVRRLFVNYSDYFGLFIHHQRFHAEFWGSFCRTPPWWGTRVQVCRKPVANRPGKRQQVNMRAVRQDARNAPVRAQVADRSNRQQPNVRPGTPERPRVSAMNTPQERPPAETSARRPANDRNQRALR